MAQEFDADYIASHRQQIHNYDSFGRSYADLVLKAAQGKMKTGEKGPIKLTAEITVSPIPKGKEGTLFCVDVTTCLPIVGCVTIHVGGS